MFKLGGVDHVAIGLGQPICDRAQALRNCLQRTPLGKLFSVGPLVSDRLHGIVVPRLIRSLGAMVVHCRVVCDAVQPIASGASPRPALSAAPSAHCAHTRYALPRLSHSSDMKARATKKPARAAPATGTKASLLKRLRAAERRARELEQRHELVMAASREGFYDWNIAKNTIHYSERVHSYLGLPPGLLKTTDDWVNRIHP